MTGKTNIKIVNIVATSAISSAFDLHAVLQALGTGASYEPETFPGLVLHIKDPKTATLIFSSGKIVCTGARSVVDVKRAIGMVVDRLIGSDFEVNKHPEVIVQNIVATSDLETDLNLTTIAISLGLENVEYNPEQFPGLVYRVGDPKIVALIFTTGKVVLTGAKEEGDLDLAIGKIRNELANAGLL